MLNTIYGQQIFAGTKTPSRDKLLAITFGMRLNPKQTDTLLKQQGYPCLYPRRKRDAVILYGYFTDYLCWIRTLCCTKMSWKR